MKRRDLKIICNKLKKVMGDNRYQESYISKNPAPKALRRLTHILKELPARPSSISEQTEEKIIRAICKSFDGHDLETVCKFVETKWLTKEKLQKAIQAYQNDQVEAGTGTELSVYSSCFETLSLSNVVIPTGNSDFDSLIGIAKNVYINLDKDKQELFCEAIQSRDWFNNPIFEDHSVLYIALGACLKGKITSSQYATLSQWMELKKRYNPNLIKIYPLLDEDGDITNDSADHLFKHLLPKFPRENIQLFRDKLKTLPFSEQVLIKIPADRYVTDAFDAGNGVLLFGNTEDIAYTALSTGAYEALMEANYGENFFQLKPQLGPVTINDIEQSMRNKARVMSTYYPHPKGTKCDNPRFFHKVPSRTTTLIGYHDMWHIYAASSAPKELYQPLFNFVDTVRAYTGKKWSSGLWDVIDYSYTALPFKDSKNPSMMLLIGVFPGHQYSLKKGYFSPEIGVLILDTHLCPKIWNSYGINSADIHHALDHRPKVMKNHKNLTHYSILEWVDFFSPSEPKLFSLFKLAIIFECSKQKIDQGIMGNMLESIQEQQENILPLITIDNKKNRNYSYSTYSNSNRKMQEMRLGFNEKYFGEGEQQDDENIIIEICQHLGIGEHFINQYISVSL